MSPYYPGSMRWDIFCKVIDNHGDVGVCWRLAAELARRGEKVRLWLDQLAALSWMAPGGQSGVAVLPWQTPVQAVPGDVVVEAFGCELDDSFVGAITARTRGAGRQPAWINLEYLSAEPYVERSHALPSPVLAGPGQGLVKHFFYPGFTQRTGGLLREHDLLTRQNVFDPTAWLHGQSLTLRPNERLASLFCYEPAVLAQWLGQLEAGPLPTRLLVTAGRAQAAVRALRPDGARGSLSLSYLPLLSQQDYDQLLWSCDFNFVRGEDSLVRALWAGRPFVWHIYPQDDGAHHAKLQAFLDWLEAPPSLRAFHLAWNGLGAAVPPALDLPLWGDCARAARARLLAQEDLATQLTGFANKTS